VDTYFSTERVLISVGGFVSIVIRSIVAASPLGASKLDQLQEVEARHVVNAFITGPVAQSDENTVQLI